MSDFHESFKRLSHLHSYKIDDVIEELRKQDESALRQLRSYIEDFAKDANTTSGHNNLSLKKHYLNNCERSFGRAADIRQAYIYAREMKNKGQKTIDLDPRDDLALQVIKIVREEQAKVETPHNPYYSHDPFH